VNKSIKYNVPTEVAQGVFRTYDIRGPVAEDGINVSMAYALGLAFGSQVLANGETEAVVGRDGRLTGEEITDALISGLLDVGCSVVNVGMVPTPLVYFATKTLSANSGIMVTASHNPGHHNGFKLVLAGQTLSTEGVQLLYQQICQQEWQIAKVKGQLEYFDILTPYKSYVVEHVKLEKPLKVVVDCGNGVAGVLVPDLYRALGCEVVELHCTVDGNFPNHHPDPTITENLQDIINAVSEHKADIGLAFDGDGDRLGVITSQGDIIWPDRQLLFFAREVLAEHPGSKIIFDVKCTHNLPRMITAWGGKPIMNKTGHSLIKKRMLEEGAPFAGEMSGHIFFNDEWFGFDDGAYVGARALRILAAQNKTSHDLFLSLPDSFNTPELKLPMAEDRKANFMASLINDSNFGDADKITIDGLRVDFGESWGLVRPSNTSAYLVIRFEANTAEELNAVQECFRRELLHIDANLVLPF